MLTAKFGERQTGFSVLLPRDVADTTAGKRWATRLDLFLIELAVWKRFLDARKRCNLRYLLYSRSPRRLGV